MYRRWYPRSFRKFRKFIEFFKKNSQNFFRSMIYIN